MTPSAPAEKRKALWVEPAPPHSPEVSLVPEQTPGLRARNFKKISLNGFGDPLNAYPHSMIWFKGRLYVGTTRANLHLLWFTIGERIKNFEIWPVEHPQRPYDLDARAQIWRYDPRSGQWERVYVSPMIMGSEGFEVPLAWGLRGMTIHQAPSDPSPALYFPTWASRLGPGPILLRSVDGRRFEQVSEPGLGDPTVTTIRSILSFKGKLFLAPTGTTKDRLSGNVPDRMVIFVNRDPKTSGWELACEPFFGDRTNLGVFCMTVYNGHIYAGTGNAEEGCQVWKTDAEGPPPYKWKKVLSHGGFRGKENQGTVSMAQFKGKLYIGTGIIGGYDRERNVGPASPELLRLGPDDSWDLVVGEPRMTPRGLKIPLSGLGAGFSSPTAGYFWYMCVHEGWLYLGTYDVTTWLPYIRLDHWPRRIRQAVEQYGVEHILEGLAGFDLWRSQDGARWFPVTRNGFGSPCNLGVRTMASSPFGLFVGVANPFGPTMAVRRLSGWEYAPNPQGGLEIWLGSRDGEQGQEEGSPRSARHPALRLDREPEAPERLYERLIDEYYEGSGFRHCGLWRLRTKSPVQACEELVEEMLSAFPAGHEHILEIGGGRGATTRAILKHFPETSLTALVKGKDELDFLRRSVPGARGRRMKGPKLKFKTGLFDAVISVEGLGPFGNPSRLLGEVYRVLRPGGKLVCSAVIYDRPSPGGGKKAAARSIADSAQGFEALLIRAGFRQVRVHDTTERSWNRFLRQAGRGLQLMLLSKGLSQDHLPLLLAHLPHADLPVKAYVICSASKEGGTAEGQP